MNCNSANVTLVAAVWMDPRGGDGSCSCGVEKCHRRHRHRLPVSLRQSTSVFLCRLSQSCLAMWIGVGDCGRV